jgi:hypothetical protein
MGDESNAARVTTPVPDQATTAPADDAAALAAERSLLRRVGSAIRFADFMAIFMVAATTFSAYATWRLTHLTGQILQVAERPYLGIHGVKFDIIDPASARLIVDCRNFGNVSASDGSVRLHVLVDGKPLPSHETLDDTSINVGMFTPTVPHPFHLFIPTPIYEQAHGGKVHFVLHVQITYQGPDHRQYCYSEIMKYDHRADAFDPAGGNDRCDGEIY